MARRKGADLTFALGGKWNRAAAIRAACGVALLAALAKQEARADETVDFQVIVHPDNPVTSTTRAFAADAFLKTTTRWSDGETIRPVDLPASSPVRRAFSETVLKRSLSAVRSYWQQRIFSGRDVPPPELDSDEAVVNYVLAHRGSVGYVTATTKLRSAKVVQIR
jgi:ABC-type phosphate transport system substrate-binding protein